MPKTLRSAREDALTPTEVEQLLRGCRDTLDSLVVRLPLFAGMRVGEMQHLRKSWLEGGLIVLPSRQLCDCYECRKWRKGIWSPKSKAGIRSLLITEEVAPTLRQFFADREAVDRSRQGLEWRVKRVWERSGLQKPTYPHALRATFATRLAEEGMSAPSLCYIMGWGGLDAAESYIQSSMKRAHSELEEVLAR